MILAGAVPARSQKGSSQSVKSLVLSQALQRLDWTVSSYPPPRPRCRWSSHGSPSHFPLTHSLSSTSQQVLIKDKKFAWYSSYPSPTSPLRTTDKETFKSESCIKGHRTSSCNHTDRPLFEIKRKGRPVSQCDKCRELRKTRRVHSKCLCSELKAEDRNRQGSTSSSGPGPKSK